MSKLQTNQNFQLWDAKTLGTILSLSKRQVFRLKSQGKLPKCVRIGGSVRWRRLDIDFWLYLGCPSQEEFEARKEAANAK
jgi:predicted DNA-binding transcriptional regulator AlpA